MSEQPMTAEREAEIREFSQTSAFGSLAARELLAVWDACRRERDEARAAADRLAEALEAISEATAGIDTAGMALAVLSAYRGQRGQQ